MPHYKKNWRHGGRRHNFTRSTSIRRQVVSSEASAKAEIYSAVRRIMFELPNHQKEILFRRYGRAYGSGAERYAREVFRSWHDGTVTMSGATATRMTQLVPAFFTRSQKFECIKALRRRAIGHHHRILHVSFTDWREKVHAELQEIVGVATNFQFSPDLLSFAQWLADDDSQQMRELLATIDAEEAATAAAYVEAELIRLEAFVRTIAHTTSATHEIKLEWGLLRVIFSIEKPKKSPLTKLKEAIGMSRENQDQNQNWQLSLPANQPTHQPGDLLNKFASGLSEKDKNDLCLEAAKQRLQLDVSALKSDQRHIDSLRDMANTTKMVNSLDQNSRADYDVKSAFDTASGKTEVRVQRKANQNVALIVIILGAILLFLILRK